MKKKATHSSIPAWRIPMDKGAIGSFVSPRGHKESDTTEQLSRHITTGQPILTSELMQNVKLKWRGYITKS